MLSQSSPTGNLAGSGARYIVLPNGTKVRHLTRMGETQFIYKEIYEENTYTRNGVTLQDDAVIVDAGANIGLFSLFALQNFKRVRTYAFEPIPDTHAALRYNLLSHAPKDSQVHLFQHGLSERPGTAEFAFFPNAPGNSTTHTEEKAEIRARLEQELLENLWQHSKLFAALLWLLGPLRKPLVRKVLDYVYKQVQVPCALRPLSDVIDEQQLERVDLLKVDVEGAELDVLRGIRDEHWPRIRQVVLELHDVNGRLKVVEDLLQRHGFTVSCEQDELMRKYATFNVYAVRS